MGNPNLISVPWQLNQTISILERWAMDWSTGSSTYYLQHSSYSVVINKGRVRGFGLALVDRWPQKTVQTS